MGICPLCNGLKSLTPACPECGRGMEDKGREADLYDEYSPYMPIDQLKLEDGYLEDFKKGECPHLFKCSHCETSRIFFIKE